MMFGVWLIRLHQEILHGHLVALVSIRMNPVALSGSLSDDYFFLLMEKSFDYSPQLPLLFCCKSGNIVIFDDTILTSVVNLPVDLFGLPVQFRQSK